MQSPSQDNSDLNSQPAAKQPPLSRVNLSLDIPQDTRLTITIETPAGQEPTIHQIITPLTGAASAFTPTQVKSSAIDWSWLTRWRGRISIGMVLFITSLFLYAVTRFWALDQYPITFFGDEAAQTVLAADFVRDGFRDWQGNFFPVYFRNEEYYNLSISVYAQVIPYMIFGRSVLVTRAVSAFVSLIGVMAVGLILRDIFKIKWWWVGVLILAATPSWFINSRTALEMVWMVSAYAWFLYFYLLYRHRDPRFLYPSLVCGAIVFYSYSPGQIVAVATGVLLLISDFQYHWQQRQTGFKGVGLLVILVLPYISFSIAHPQENFSHLRILDSYWVKSDLTLPQKLARFGEEYYIAVTPGFWYIPDNMIRDIIIRQRMKGYAQLSLLTFPFYLLGILICLRYIKSSAHRTVLLAMLASGLSGTPAEVTASRVLAYIIPATLFAGLGLEQIQKWLTKKISLAPLTAITFIAFATAGLMLTNDALTNGATWYDDYDIGGLQYGAPQLGQEIKKELRQSPNTDIRLSPTWTNGASYIYRFFFPNEARVQIENIQAYSDDKKPLDKTILFVVPVREYELARTNPKFSNITVERTVLYPNGQPGFFFLRLTYSPQADALFAAEEAERRKPINASLNIKGQAVQVAYSRFDAGRIEDLFDGDLYTLARVDIDNPAAINLTFENPQSLNGITATFGAMDFMLTVKVFPPGATEPKTFTQTYKNLPPDPTVRLNFDSTLQAQTIRIEVLQINTETPKIHIREMTLR